MWRPRHDILLDLEHIQVRVEYFDVESLVYVCVSEKFEQAKSNCNTY